MHATRRMLLVRMFLDFVNAYWDDIDHVFVADEACQEHNLTRVELCMDGRLMFSPETAELQALDTKSRNGNWRTRQLVQLAIAFAADQLEEIHNRYPYEGEQERFVDTHVHFDGVNFRAPTQEDITELFTQLDAIVKALPPIPTHPIAWQVYGPDPDEDDSEYRSRDVWLDTVYYDASCDSQYVRAILVGHDGYPTNIELVA